MFARDDIRTRRSVWAWLCIAAWLVLVFGPVVHAVGHDDDHVHVHGTVVHDHDVDLESATPEAAIAQAREASDEERRKPSKPDKPHGFDVGAHFVATTLGPAIPPLALLPKPELTHDEIATEHSVATSATRDIVRARGPPAA